MERKRTNGRKKDESKVMGWKMRPVAWKRSARPYRSIMRGPASANSVSSDANKNDR